MLIRSRITLVSLAATVTVAATLSLAAYSAQRAAEQRFAAVSLSGTQILLDQLVGRHAAELSAFTKALTRDSVTIEALRRGDGKALQEQVDTTHNLFYSDGTLDRLQILDPQGNYLATAPQPFSGTTAKALVSKAASEGIVVPGLTLDDDGEFQVAIAFPLYARGKLRGVAVYSRNMQRFIDDFQRNDGSDVFVFDQAGKRRYAAGNNQARDIDWSPSDAETGALDVVQQDGRYHAISAIPIRNVAGQAIATLVVAADETETYQIQATARYTSLSVVLVILIGAALGLFWYIRRAFTPIEQVISSMTAIAAGDLGCQVPARDQDDETGRLTRALCGMVQQLRELVADITASSEQLTIAGQSLQVITAEGSHSIAQQSVETDQVATAVNQMTATVQEVARNAAEAALSATQASEKAAGGKAIVTQTIASINKLAGDVEQAGSVVSRLRTESENIGAVLDVIRAISEQTNLLALNAAIEAARAGEQGRGFAVVADEVRTLASRTQASTAEIQKMISRLQEGALEAVEVIHTSQSSSAATVEQATRAGEALSAITESVAQSNAMNGQIAKAAEEQYSVAEMINTSVVHIAALAEASRERTGQTATAASTMSELSGKLEALVHRFRV